MFKNPSFLFDILCTVVWLVLMVRYARKGFLRVHRAAVRQPHQPAGRTAALLPPVRAGCSKICWPGASAPRSPPAFRPDGVVNLSGIAQTVRGLSARKLPRLHRGGLRALHLGAVLSDNAVVLADAIVQKVLAPLLTPVISLVLFFVTFALLRMLVSMLVTVLGLVNRLPVIGTVNRWLGWITGGIASTMDIYLVLCVVWAIIVITGGNLTVLNDTVMSSSLYYKAFNLFNPFL